MPIFAYILALFLILIIQPINGLLSLDTFIPYSTSAFQCIKGQGFNLVTLRGVSNMNVDSVGLQNMNNAKNAGMNIDMMVMVCRNQTASEVANFVKNKIDAKLYTNIWLIFDTTASKNCSWNSSIFPIQQNCPYLQTLISEFKKVSLNPGIQANNQMWKQFFGDEKACSGVSSSRLWWTGGPDGRPNFDNYKQVGGWASLNNGRKKVTASSSICGASLAMNLQ